MTRIYEGWREVGTPGAGVVVVFEPGKPRRSLAPRLDLANKSPTGLSWGYSGSGPAQLALALVADATGDDQLALRVFQEFKFKFCARWGQTWRITQDEVQAFVERIEQDRATLT